MCECVFVSKWWSVYGMTFDHDTSTHQCILDWVRLIVPSQFPSNNVGCELSHTNTQQPSLCLIPNKKATQPDASKNLRSPAHSTAHTYIEEHRGESYLNEWFHIEGMCYQNRNTEHGWWLRLLVCISVWSAFNIFQWKSMAMFIRSQSVA